MQIRKLHGAEALDAALIGSISFQTNTLYQRFLPDIPAMRAGEKPIPFPKEHPDDPKTLWGAVDDEGLVTAAITAVDFQQRFDGAYLPMCGIQGVCSLPEKRRGGAVRAILRAVLADAAHNGAVLSYLYPFAHPFYERMGYAIGSRRMHTRIPMQAMLPFAGLTGDVRAVTPALAANIKTVYDAFAAHYNGMLLRTDSHLWRTSFLHGDAIEARRYAYLCYSASGMPEAYVVFSPHQEGERRIMQVRELCFISPAALRHAFGFLSRLSAQYDFIDWTAPEELNLESYLPEPKLLECRLNPNGQVRLLHIEKALSHMKHPRYSGSYTLFLHDELLSELSGAYHVTFTATGAQATRKALAEEQTDISLSIAALSTMAFGATPLSAAEAREDVCLRANRDLLLDVFPSKPAYIADFF